MNRRRALVSLIAMAAIGSPVQMSYADDPAYELTVLSGMGDNGDNAATAISEWGTIVGRTSPLANGRLGAVGGRPLFWHNTHPHILPGLPGHFGLNNRASAINADGVVVGGCAYPGAPEPLGVFLTHPVMWDGGGITYLGALPGDEDGIATAINDSGAVVGISGPALYVVFGGARAFHYADGVMEELLGLAGAVDTTAADISSAGIIVGSSGDPFGPSPVLDPVYWDNGVLNQLALPNGAVVGRADVINDNGVIAGGAGTPNPTLPLPDFWFSPVRWVNDQPEWLPMPAGDNFGFITGINDAGDMVGVTGLLDPIFGFPISQRAVAWIGEDVIDLNEAADMPAEWTAVFANDINGSGEICGSASVGLGLVAFVLSPNSP